MTVLFHDIHEDEQLQEELDEDRILGAVCDEVLYADDTIIHSTKPDDDDDDGDDDDEDDDDEQGSRAALDRAPDPAARSPAPSRFHNGAPPSWGEGEGAMMKLTTIVG